MKNTLMKVVYLIQESRLEKLISNNVSMPGSD